MREYRPYHRYNHNQTPLWTAIEPIDEGPFMEVLRWAIDVERLEAGAALSKKPQPTR